MKEQPEAWGEELGPGLGAGSGWGSLPQSRSWAGALGTVPGELRVQAVHRGMGVQECQRPGDTSAPVIRADGVLAPQTVFDYKSNLCSLEAPGQGRRKLTGKMTQVSPTTGTDASWYPAFQFFMHVFTCLCNFSPTSSYSNSVSHIVKKLR